MSNLLKRRWPFAAAQEPVPSAGLSDVTMDSEEPTIYATPAAVPAEPQPQPQPQRGLKRKDPLDKIVDIVVGNGDDAKSFEHHRRILSKESQHFRAAFKKDWEAPSFSFPNEDPEIYGRVAHWMYFKEFVFDEEKDQSSEAEGDSTQLSEDIENEGIRSTETSRGGENSRDPASPIPTIEVVDMESSSDDSDKDDDDQADQAPEGSQAQIDPPTPLDTLTLSKVWALAKRLGIPKLCDEIINLLGKRLGYDMKTPGDALVYAFQRCRRDSPLRRLLVDFTARSAPITDLLEDATFDATNFAPELWCALVGGLVTVRGDKYLERAEWAQNFEETVSDYYISKSRLPLRPATTAHA